MKNKKSIPAICIFSILIFLIGMCHIYAASQGHTMQSHGFPIESWQVAAMGIGYVVMAFYLWRWGMKENKNNDKQTNFEEDLQNGRYTFNEWSLLNEFNNYAEAELMKSMLQDLGISTKIEPFNKSLFSNNVVKLYVDTALLHRAKLILKDTISDAELDKLAMGKLSQEMYDSKKEKSI